MAFTSKQVMFRVRFLREILALTCVNHPRCLSILSFQFFLVSDMKTYRSEQAFLPLVYPTKLFLKVREKFLLVIWISLYISQVQSMSLTCTFVFSPPIPRDILVRIFLFVFHNLCVHMHVQKLNFSKELVPMVSSRGLYWENRLCTSRRCVSSFCDFIPSLFCRVSRNLMNRHLSLSHYIIAKLPTPNNREGRKNYLSSS